MIQAADAFFKSSHKTAPVKDNALYYHAGELFCELHAHHTKKSEETFSTYSLFLQIMYHETIMQFASNPSLVILTMRPLDYDGTGAPER